MGVETDDGECGHRHVLKAINTLMLFEPNHRLLVKAGVDDLLVLFLPCSF